MEIKYRVRKLIDIEKKGIVKDYNLGIPLLKIMEKYGIAKTTIYRVLQQAEGGDKK